MGAVEDRFNAFKIGFDGALKIECLESMNVSESTMKSYSEELINIMNYETQYNKSIFNLSKEEAERFIVLESKGPSSKRDRLGSIIKHYFKTYKSYNPEAKNNLSELLGDSKLLSDSFLLEVDECFTSYDNLLKIANELNAKPITIAIVSFLYMGFSKEEIIQLRVKDVDFINREIMIGNKYYFDINETIFKNITYQVKDMEEGEVPVCRASGTGKIQIELTSKLCEINKMAKARNIRFKFTMKNLWQSGAFYYLKIRENEFGKNSDEKIHEVLRCFNGINKDQISKGWDNRCKNDFNGKYNRFINSIDSNTRLFGVTFMPDFTNKGEVVINKKVTMNDTYFGEVPREENGDKKSKYQQQQEIGNENEQLVLRELRKINGCTQAELMADFSGFDIKAMINKKVFRIEVKTIDSDLQFYLSRNEFITSKNKEVVLALVLNKKRVLIKILPDIIESLGLNYNKLVDVDESNKYCIRSEDFKIKLSEQLFSELKDFNEYFDEIFSGKL